jgi:hypothetical protein
MLNILGLLLEDIRAGTKSGITSSNDRFNSKEQQ